MTGGYVTPRLKMSLPPQLIEAAREALGLPETTSRAAVVRASLASLSGLDADAYPLARRGPKPGTPRAPRRRREGAVA
jgi:hypothetical protein